jgi:formamidopyrimidine-DNA glycosylase
MPELPEVEIVKRELSNSCIGKKITSFEKSEFKLRRPIPSLDHLIGQKFVHIHRRNKYLILETHNNWIVIHLGMTGQLLYNKDGNSSGKHIHFTFKFYDNSILYYQDPRRFGLIESYYKTEYPYFNQIPLFKNLGIEPLGTFEEEDFLNLFTKKRTAKSFLLDGNMVCGIGNIYANEILFKSKVNPAQNILELPIEKRKEIYSHIKPTLNKAIELGGSSISDYVHTNGTKGEMQNFYKVYGRNNCPCFDCGTKIEKIMQNARGSFYCPKCQPIIGNKIETKIRNKK